jgi:hypothetical protein
MPCVNFAKTAVRRWLNERLPALRLQDGSNPGRTLPGTYWTRGIRLDRHPELKFRATDKPHPAFIAPTPAPSLAPSWFVNSQCSPQQCQARQDGETSASALNHSRGRHPPVPLGWKGWIPVEENYTAPSSKFVDDIPRCDSRTRSGRL